MTLNITGGSDGGATRGGRVASDVVAGFVDGASLFSGVIPTGVDATARGWVGIGTGAAWGAVRFDRFSMDLG